MWHHSKLEMCPLEHEWPATYKVEAPLRVGFLEISRYSRHLSSAEPDIGCVYPHTIQRWTIYISSDSKKLTRRYGLAFEKFRGIRDIHRAPNRMSGCIPSYYTTMNYLYKFRLKNVDAVLRFGFREISLYSRHSSNAEPDVGCVYHHTIQRWTIYISSDSKKLKRRYGLAFEKFRDIWDIYRVPNRMSGVYTIILYNDEPFLKKVEAL